MANTLKSTKLTMYSLYTVNDPITDLIKLIKSEFSVLGMETFFVYDSATYVNQSVFIANLGSEILIDDTSFVHPDETTQSFQSTKLSSQILVQVDTPIVLLKSKMALIGIEAVTKYDSNEYANQSSMISKIGTELLIDDTSFVHPDEIKQSFQSTKSVLYSLLSVVNPYIPIKNKISILGLEAIAIQSYQEARMSKLGAEIIQTGSVPQAIQIAKLGTEVLYVTESKTITTTTRPDNWYDENQQYRQLVVIDGSIFPQDLADNYIGIMIDETGNAIFGRNYSYEKIDNFDAGTLAGYEINEADPASIYMSSGELVINSYANRYSHLQLNKISNKNFEVTCKIKVGSNSGEEQSPGFGMWWDRGNNFMFKNRYSRNNLHLDWVDHYLYQSYTGSVLTGSTSYIWYKARFDDNWACFYNSTDGTNYNLFQKITRPEFMMECPTKFMIGKGYYQPSEYPETDWNNNGSTSGNLGLSYIDDLTVLSQGNGYDLIITDADTKTKYDHELSLWEPTQGKIVMVSRPDLLKSGVPNRFYIYYGNKNSAVNYSDPTETWTYMAGNDMVMRFTSNQDGTSVTAKELTYTNNPTISASLNNASKIADGLCAKALKLNGDTDYIQVPNHKALDIKTNNIKSFEFVLQMDTTDGGTLISKHGTDSDPSLMGYEVKAAKDGVFSIDIRHNSSESKHTTFYNSDKAHHDNTIHVFEIMVDRSKEKARFWIDNTEVDTSYTGAALNAHSSVNITSSKDLLIGKSHTDSASKFSGILGHMRITDEVRYYSQLEMILGKNKWIQFYAEDVIPLTKSDLLVDLIFHKDHSSVKVLFFNNQQWKTIYRA